MERSRTKMKKGLLLLPLMAISIGLVGVEKSYAWGKTWMGAALELAVREAAWKFGPFRIHPALNLRDAGYDSNLYYGHAGEPVKDYTVTAGSEFILYLPLKKRIIFQVDESPQYVYYYETKTERTLNNFFNARVHFALNRLFISVGNGLSYARQRWSMEIDILPRRWVASWDGLALWQATKKTSFLVQGSRTSYDFEDVNFGSFNIRYRLSRWEDRLNFMTYYQLTYRARLFAKADYGSFEFKSKGSSFKNSKSYGLYGGIEFSPFGIIRGRINIGYKFFEPVDKTKTRYKGLSGDSQLSVSLFKFLTARASYAKDIQFSVWYNNAYYLENRAGGGASLYLFKNIRLDYDYWLGKNAYPEADQAGAGESLKRRDDYLIHSLGLYFRLKKNVGLGVIASRWRRDSNLDGEDDDRDFIGLNLTYDF